MSGYPLAFQIPILVSHRTLCTPERDQPKRLSQRRRLHPACAAPWWSVSRSLYGLRTIRRVGSASLRHRYSSRCGCGLPELHPGLDGRWRPDNPNAAARARRSFQTVAVRRATAARQKGFTFPTSRFYVHWILKAAEYAALRAGIGFVVSGEPADSIPSVLGALDRARANMGRPFLFASFTRWDERLIQMLGGFCLSG
jgi:hypothetical protein